MKEIDLSLKQKSIPKSKSAFLESAYLEKLGKPYELIMKTDFSEKALMDVILFDIPNLNIQDFDKNGDYEKSGIKITSKTVDLSYLDILKILSKNTINCGTIIVKTKFSGKFNFSEKINLESFVIDQNYALLLKNVNSKEHIVIHFYPPQ